MKGREELFSFKIPAPSGPGAKIGRPRPSTTATPRKLPLHSHSAFKPFAHYSDRLLVTASGFLLQSIQQLGRDPFLGTLRLVDDSPGLVVLPVLRVKSEEWIVGIARTAVGAGAGVD